jgi:hypothetical protein
MKNRRMTTAKVMITLLVGLLLTGGMAFERLVTGDQDPEAADRRRSEQFRLYQSSLPAGSPEGLTPIPVPAIRFGTHFDENVKDSLAERSLPGCRCRVFFIPFRGKVLESIGQQADPVEGWPG